MGHPVWEASDYVAAFFFESVLLDMIVWKKRTIAFLSAENSLVKKRESHLFRSTTVLHMSWDKTYLKAHKFKKIKNYWCVKIVLHDEALLWRPDAL